MKLTRAFYTRGDVQSVARELLGKVLCSRIDGRLCRALITETEAYAGVADKASHAFGGRRTARTEPMFANGGCAYVYLCYGMHHLFNVVTATAGTPHAVLVRAVSALDGEYTMLERRRRRQPDASFLVGPGKVAQAFGITTALSGASLCGSTVWIEDGGDAIVPSSIAAGPRIGVDYAAEHAALPYRFVARGVPGAHRGAARPGPRRRHGHDD
ncbi:MAG TPA: DNA-3-methyladenine glycosylase [Woeseiaceae bacterium]|nr:DNA-3-methyladenine glycosylase [Woeseiaceae bacterium]